jgi:effector-binding domain-containing protein
MDPKAKVDISDDAKYYEWSGDRVGSGNMKITDEKPYASVDYDLTFLKPWKSKAKVRFEMHGHGDHSHVTWTMDSSLPFFMFWMKKSMEGYVGMDYERGLLMLKDYVEHDKVLSKLEFPGIKDFEGCKFVGIRTQSNSNSMNTNMNNDFERLWNSVGQDGAAGDAFTIYHKWDMMRDDIRYTACIPVKEIPGDLPKDMITGEIPHTSVHTIRHVGPYSHLGNAWSAQYNYHRGKVFKVNKKLDPFEVYLNSPGEVSDEELITDIHFPVK